MTDDQLSVLLHPLGDNTVNLARLRKQISTRLGIIPFVGAGLSIPIGFKSWSEFVLDQACKAGIEPEARAKLAAGDYEEAGEAVLAARGRRAFLNAIDLEYGDARLGDQPLLGAVGVLPRLAEGPVITTNFDHVLERAFETAGARFDRVVWGAKATSAHAALTQDKHFLLKLHGDVDEQTDRVLTRADYDKYYASGSLLRRTLRDLFVARPTLFIGCSLTSDRWVQLLGEVVQANTAVEHFALVEYPPTDEEYPQRQRFLSDHGISPIWFPNTRFDLIEAILESLSPVAGLSTSLVRRNRLISGPTDSILAHTTGFVGRADEVTAVLQFLHNVDNPRAETILPSSKIFVITGSPGIGKSEVCKEALQQFLREQPATRAYYVELEDVREEMGLLARLAEAFDLPEATLNRVYATIAAQPCLVYLDNLEDMLGDRDAFATLRKLVDIPDVYVLASSREHVAQFGRDLQILQLDPDAAAELFMNEWGRSEPHPPLTDSLELREFVETNLGCHALSIVLVAAQAYQSASLYELVKRWRDEATRLAHLPHGHNRLTSLDVSLERSLTAVQREYADSVTLWGLCALFPNGMSPAAFEAVTAAFANPKSRAREVLLRLNIVRFQQLDGLGNGAAESRTDKATMLMLAPLRRFILEKAQEGAAGLNIDLLLNPALAYFSGLATAAQQTELGDEGTARGIALDRLLPEFPNLRDVVVLAAQRGTQWGDSLGNLNCMLQNSYQSRALVGIEILRTLLPLHQQEQRTMDTARTLMQLGELENLVGEVDAARQHYAQAMERYAREQDDLGLANVLSGLGDLESLVGEVDAARQHYTQAMKLCTEGGNVLGLANVLTGLGDLEGRIGEADLARQHYTQAMKLYTQERSDIGLVRVLTGLGDLESRIGDVGAARPHYEEAMRLSTERQYDLGLANALMGLGNLESRLGDVGAARSHYEEAMKLSAREQNVLGLANALNGLAGLERCLGEFDAARQHYVEAMKLYKQGGISRGVANVLNGLGSLERSLGKVDAARQYYAQAIDLYTQEQDDLGVANVLRSLGCLELMLKQFEQAGVHLVHARELYLVGREMMGLGYTCAELARVAHALSQTGQADQYLNEGMRAAQASNVPGVVQYVIQAKTEIHPNGAKHDGEPGD